MHAVALLRPFYKLRRRSRSCRKRAVRLAQHACAIAQRHISYFFNNARIDNGYLCDDFVVADDYHDGEWNWDGESDEEEEQFY